MPLYPDPLHGNIRYRTFPFAVVGAGVLTPGTLTTPDDAERRLVTGIQATVQAAGIRYQISRTGYLAAEIDGSLISAAAGFYPVDLLFERGINILLAVNNTSAANSVAAAVTVRYELLSQPQPA